MHLYRSPPTSCSTTLQKLLAPIPGRLAAPRQPDLLASRPTAPIPIYTAGKLGLLARACVSIVGSRRASSDGIERARASGRALALANIVVLSGLAEGVDTAAMAAAIAAGGSVIGVLGTSLDRASPASNAALQQQVWQHHLLLSLFPAHLPTHRSHFARRTRLMAHLAEATVIAEAADASGTLIQAEECLRIGRPLLLPRAALSAASLSWPRRYLDYSNVALYDGPDELLRVLARMTGGYRG